MKERGNVDGTEAEFTFDLERMKRAMGSGTVERPKLRMTKEEKREWTSGVTREKKENSY